MNARLIGIVSVWVVASLQGVALESMGKPHIAPLRERISVGDETMVHNGGLPSIDGADLIFREFKIGSSPISDFLRRRNHLPLKRIGWGGCDLDKTAHRGTSKIYEVNLALRNDPVGSCLATVFDSDGGSRSLPDFIVRHVSQHARQIGSKLTFRRLFSDPNGVLGRLGCIVRFGHSVASSFKGEAKQYDTGDPDDKLPKRQVNHVVGSVRRPDVRVHAVTGVVIALGAAALGYLIQSLSARVNRLNKPPKQGR